ncbi:methyltransferase domain-containing protein [Priestia koreensis]|uniref:class I SAM-dependent methyltransferase n=1 Tax=Priestia koreensis TaxID=284581 RepID=UPI003D059D8A
MTQFGYLDFLAQMGVGGAHPGGLSLTSYLLAQETITDQTAILDIGCGTGQTAAYIYSNFPSQLSACDANEMMVKKANQRFHHHRLPLKATVENAELLSFPDESFHLVLSESVSTFTRTDYSLAEYHRVLKPGGVLLAIETTKNPSLTDETAEELRAFYRFPRMLTEQEWIDALQIAGFRKTSSLTPPSYEEDLEEQVENGTDFSLTHPIPQAIYDILARHEELAPYLSFSIFRAVK